MRLVSNKKGSVVTDIVLFAAVVVFVLFPVFAAVVEKYVMLAKGQVLKDAIDMTNVSAYYAMKVTDTSKTVTIPEQAEAHVIYMELLAKNLRLNDDLTPKENSIAEGPVEIESLIIYAGGFPVSCANGTIMERVSIHSIVTVPVRPTLYRGLILQAVGKDFVELKVHVDSDIPVNN